MIMKKLLLTMMTALLMTMPAVAEDQKAITEQPEGKLIDNMVLSFKGYKNIGSPTYLVEEARIAKIVEGTDGCIYIYNLFDYDTFKSWVKATRGDGDTIVIKRQLVHTNPQSSGTTELLYVAKYKTWLEDEPDPKTGQMRHKVMWEQTDDDIKMLYRNGVVSTIDEYNRGADGSIAPYAIGCSYYSSGAFYKDLFIWWNVNIRPLNQELVTPGDYTHADRYQMTFKQLNSDYVQYVDAVTVGNDIYLKLLKEIDGWVKGTISGNQVIIPTGQYLGHYDITTSDNHGRHYHMFSHVGTAEIYTDIKTKQQYDSLQMAEQIVLDYNPVTRAISSPGGEYISIDAAQNKTYYLTYFKSPQFTMTVDEIAIPQAPTFLTYQNLLKDFGSCNFAFQLPLIDTNNKSLDPGKLYFNVFVDGDTAPFELTSDDYQVDAPVVDIPYDADIKSLNGAQWAGYMDVYGNKVHIMRFGFEPAKSVGVRSVYKSGGVSSYSQILWYDIATQQTSYTESPENDPSGIRQVRGERLEAKEENYYDMTGRQVPADTKGLLIKVVTRSDGTKHTSKVIR